MAINRNEWMPLPEKLHDFRAFLWMVWDFLGLPPPTPIQNSIAFYLQHGPRRKIIEGFRGVAKSWITSAYVVWRLRMDPQKKFLVVSASKQRSDDFTTFTLRLIREMPILQCLIPEADQRESKIAFDVGPAQPDHSPSVKSVGIFGQLTGTRADEIVGDDVEVPNNSLTQGMRERLSESVKEFDAILKPGGRITYLGTPQTEMTIYNLLEQRGYQCMVWPVRFPTPEQAPLYGDRLATIIAQPLEKDPKLAGKPTEPTRFDEFDLMEREASYGKAGFALQFMLDTRMSDFDRYPLKLSDLIVTDLDQELAPEKLIYSRDPKNAWTDLPCVGLGGDRYYRPSYVSPEMQPYKGIIMAIDPSGRGNNETSYCITGMLNGYVFLLDAGGFMGGYADETLEALALTAKRWKVKEIVIESNFGDGMFGKLLQPLLKKHHNCKQSEVRFSVQKERRIIESLEPVMSQHRLVVNRSVVEKDNTSTKHLPQDTAYKYQLFYQMSRMTNLKGALSIDDRIDVVAIGVEHWKQAMSQSVDEKVAQRREQALKEDLDLFTGQGTKSIDRLFLERDQVVKDLMPDLEERPERYRLQGLKGSLKRQFKCFT